MFRSDNEEGLFDFPHEKVDIYKENETASYLFHVSENIEKYGIFVAIATFIKLAIDAFASSRYIDGYYSEVKINFLTFLIGLAWAGFAAWLAYWGIFYISRILRGYSQLIQQNDYQTKIMFYRLWNPEKSESTSSTVETSSEMKEPENPKEEDLSVQDGFISEIEKKKDCREIADYLETLDNRSEKMEEAIQEIRKLAKIEKIYGNQKKEALRILRPFFEKKADN